MIAVVIRDRADITSDIVVLELASRDGIPLPEFAPGAHVDLELEAGMVRQYSLCDPWNGGDCYRVAIRRDPNSRGGSAFIHDCLKLGDALSISAPRNAFHLSDAAGCHVLLAAGIGITPLYCMAQELQARGVAFELHVFARSHDTLPFAQELAGLVSLKLHLGLASEEVAPVMSGILARSAPGTHAYACGPAPFMSIAEAMAADTLGREHYHQERFSPLAASVEPDATTAEVVLSRSGLTLCVPPEQSILEAVEDAGICVMSSCRTGICGSCLTTVVSGAIDHRDDYLTSREKEDGRVMLLCVSRAKAGKLVLDL